MQGKAYGFLDYAIDEINSPFLTIGYGHYLVHHVIALGLYGTMLIYVKGALDASVSKLMLDKKDFSCSFLLILPDKVVVMRFWLGTHFICQFSGC